MIPFEKQFVNDCSKTVSRQKPSIFYRFRIWSVIQMDEIFSDENISRIFNQKYIFKFLH